MGETRTVKKIFEEKLGGRRERERDLDSGGLMMWKMI
jgi:hypothetical protein